MHAGVTGPSIDTRGEDDNVPNAFYFTFHSPGKK